MNERKTYPGRAEVCGDGGQFWGLLYREAEGNNEDCLDFRGPSRASIPDTAEDLRRWLRTHGWERPEGWAQMFE